MFGRNSEKADTELQNKDISQIHATIRWDGCVWILNDLSRNGIWIDGIRIVPGKNTGIKEGNIIRFSSADQLSWKLIDPAPPATVLMPLQGNEEVIKLDRFHVLPDDSTPDRSIYISHNGEWVYENEHGVTPLNSGDIISHDQGRWQFFCAEPVEYTHSIKEEMKIRFLFRVSIDEEHVVVKITIGENTIDLGERVHHYMILTLARQRLNDAENGIDLDSQGWVDIDRLAEMLGMDSNHLNIQIFRVRKQVSKALSELLNLPQVIERRVGSLRFGFADFQIMRGSSVEGTLSQGKPNE